MITLLSWLKSHNSALLDGLILLLLVVVAYGFLRGTNRFDDYQDPF